MEEQQILHVKIAEIKTGTGNTILKTTLGSCVGIGFFWKEKNLFGLAHCLLPEAPEPMTHLTAKYVDQAIPSLLTLMKISKENFKKIDAVVVGGANMMVAKQKEHNHIGLLNSLEAVKRLKELGIRIIHQETGGNEATQISIHCLDGSFNVSHIAKQKTESIDYGTL